MIVNDLLRRGTMRVNERGHLEIGGCDCVLLAKKFGTPLYVMDEELIRANCRRYIAAFKKHYPGSFQVAYAAKAFLVLYMVRLIREEGLWLDVASGGELFTALKAGFPADQILFHGNYKTDEEIVLALRHRVGRIVVDSEEELDRLDQLAGQWGGEARILLRITPGVEAHTHQFNRTGQIDSKFGIPLEEGLALRAIKKALGKNHLLLMGLHCHIGSQVFEKEPFEVAAEVMMGLAAEAKGAFGFELKELNLGGGLGVRYVSEDDPPAVEEFVESLCRAVITNCRRLGLTLPSLLIEPGRSIVGEAGTTLYTVGVVKEVPAVRTYVSVDGGMSDNPRPALYDARYSAVLANRACDAPDCVVTVSGKHCESDTLIRDVRLPRPKPGDLLAVLTTGAYHHSMASNYNRFLRPAVVFVKEGKALVACRRETYDDLLKTEILEPDWKEVADRLASL
ncbi:MAG: diaminopimelate decarboxylase [Armatimonadetes bacterium]|nr:diaminopimelate decarboxylase [Armatimonadota bacterium]MDW8122011.1 diaminopimelate decarboxylase [Armatimonadota bacterium]